MSGELAVVDSCGWLEYFADGQNAAFFAVPMQEPSRIIVPTICLYEVYKKVTLARSDREALISIEPMQRCRVVDLDAELALTAARLSVRHGMPMADSLILATARRFGAVVWTQDAHFTGLSDVRMPSLQ